MTMMLYEKRYHVIDNVLYAQDNKKDYKVQLSDDLKRILNSEICIINNEWINEDILYNLNNSKINKLLEKINNYISKTTKNKSGISIKLIDNTENKKYSSYFLNENEIENNLKNINIICLEGKKAIKKQNFNDECIYIVECANSIVVSKILLNETYINKDNNNLSCKNKIIDLKSLAINKALEMAVDTNANENYYYILNKDNNPIISEKYYMEDISLCSEYDNSPSDKNISFDDTFKYLSKFQKLNDIWFTKFGVENYDQVPFNLCESNFIYNGKVIKTYGVGNNLYESFFDSFKKGICNYFNTYLKENDNENWGIKSENIDHYNVILEVLFEKKYFRNNIKRYCIDLKLVCELKGFEYFKNLLKYNNYSKLYDKFNIYIYEFEDVQAYKVELINNEFRICEKVGNNLDELIYYSLMLHFTNYVQNTINEKYKIINKIIDAERITNKIDLQRLIKSRRDTESYYKDIENFLKKNSLSYKIIEWKHNNLLEDTNLKLIKVKIINKIDK